MALSGNTLGDELLAAINGVSDPTDRQALFRAMGNAIVDHIKAHAQVVVTSVTGVTAGAAASGPGTGTVT